MNIPTFLNDVLNYVIWNNSIRGYIFSIILFIVLLLAFSVFRKLVLKRIENIVLNTKNEFDDLLIKVIQIIKPSFVIFLSLFIALRFLSISPKLQRFLDSVLIIWIIYLAIIALQILTDYVLRVKVKKIPKTTTELISRIIKGTLWGFGILMILSNLGININSLIAGLGIGGIAAALAIQNILGDLFSSFAIYLDRPFELGDFIIVGEELGTVEKIGVKTTRIKSLWGEEVVISNRELTSVRIHNYKKMQTRRVAFNFGVTYQTTVEQLKIIPQIVRDIIESVELTRFDRANFNKFGDFALLFEVVYYVGSPDYNIYMNINEKIHLKIKEELEARNISMAYPTQTIYLEKVDK